MQSPGTVVGAVRGHGSGCSTGWLRALKMLPTLLSTDSGWCLHWPVGLLASPMDPNTHSTPPSRPLDDDLAALQAIAGRLAARDLDRLPDAVRAARVLALRPVLDGLEGHWLKELAGVDARGAAGAEAGRELGSTAAWLRGRLRLGPRRPAPSGPPGRCSAVPWQPPAKRYALGRSRPPMPRCWPPPPKTCPTR